MRLTFTGRRLAVSEKARDGKIGTILKHLLRRAQLSIKAWKRLPGKVGRKRAATSVLTLLLMSGTHAVWAQSDQGSINGVVQDPTGAVVPQAQVTIVNQETGFQLRTTADAGGVYSFPPLKVGAYTVTVSAPGFATSSQKDVAVTVAQTSSIPVKLTPGGETTVVNVTGAPPQMQTEDASTGQTISSQTINQTPLVGRNFVFIAQLTAGVLPSNQGARGAGTGDFSANGQRAEQNNFILDGVDNNVNLVDFPNGSSFVIQPPPDALQEFRVQTSDYTAELGHSAGAVVNVAVKSGSNQIHGDLWEYFRNDAINARNYFPAGVLSKPEYRQNQFGATLGGPIIKDKLFFFGDVQASRIVFPNTGTYTVPTALMRTGDFSELLNPTIMGGTPVANPTYNGQTTNTRQLFLPGGPAVGIQQYNGRANVLAPGQIDPVAQNLYNLFPLPNTGNGAVTNNYNFQGKAINNATQYDTRVDWNASQTDQLFARYSYSQAPGNYAPPLGPILDGGGFGATGNNEDEGRNFTASYTHSFNPKLTNEFRVGYNWIHASYQQPNAGTDIAPTLGLGGIPYTPGLLNGGLPVLAISNTSTAGAPAFEVTNEYENVAQLLDNVTKVAGNHTIRGGVNFERIRVQTEQPDYSRGQYNFTGAYTQDPANAGTTGWGGADFLKGAINSSALSSLFVVHDQRWYMAGYLQDDWKATPQLTVNFGLRYEYVQPTNELDGHQANFVPDYTNNTGVYLIPNKARNIALPPAFLAALTKDGIALQYTSNKFLVNPDKKNFAPRVGLSYKLNDTSVVRAGFGIFYGGLESVGFYPNLGESSPFDIDSNFPAPSGCTPTNCPTNGQTLETGFAAALAEGLGNFASIPALRSYQVNTQTPYSEQYNLAVEKSFGETTATLSYVGATSHHLQSNPDPNQGITPRTSDDTVTSQQLRPFPDFGGSSLISYAGFSSYNSAQASLERRYHSGLSFLASYTFSHSLDDAYLPLGGSGQSGSGFRNWRLLGYGYDYGDSFQDVRHRATLNTQYELPFGQGKRYLNHGTLLNEVVGGWTGSLVFRVQSGQPTVIYANNNPTNGVGAEAYAYKVSNPNTSSDGVKTRTVATWFNPAAFVNPGVSDGTSDASTIASYGPPGRTMVYGPGYNRVDVTAFKDFAVFREQKVEFRGELYNVLNTPAYGQPGNTLGSSGFGQITGSRFSGLQPDGRAAQFALKYLF